MKLSDFANMNDWWKRLDEAISRQVNLGLAGRKESLMACEGTYQGEPLCREPGEGVSLPSNVEQVPEGCGHYYDEQGWGWWISFPAGNPPPADHIAVGANGQQPVKWPDPHVVFGTDPARPELGNTVAQNDGYAPGPVWYRKGDVSGSPSNPNGGPASKTAALLAITTLSAYIIKAK